MVTETDISRPDVSGVFPSSDHFPVGRAYGTIDEEVAPASAVRPFGLSLAVRPRESVCLDPDALAYDVARQIGLIREGDEVVPLMRHTDGQTSTSTNADGHKGPDSDTDHRED